MAGDAGDLVFCNKVTKLVQGLFAPIMEKDQVLEAHTQHLCPHSLPYLFLLKT
jgi:hypothetical protein